MRRSPGWLGRALLLLGLAFLIGKLFVAGEMVKYMSPTLDPLTALTGIVLAALGVLELVGAGRDGGRALHEPSRFSAMSALARRHDEGPHPAGLEDGLTDVLVLVFILLGLAVAPRALGSGALGGESRQPARGLCPRGGVDRVRCLGRLADRGR